MRHIGSYLIDKMSGGWDGSPPTGPLAPTSTCCRSRCRLTSGPSGAWGPRRPLCPVPEPSISFLITSPKDRVPRRVAGIYEDRIPGGRCPTGLWWESHRGISSGRRLTDWCPGGDFDQVAGGTSRGGEELTSGGGVVVRGEELMSGGGVTSGGGVDVRGKS